MSSDTIDAGLRAEIAFLRSALAKAEGERARTMIDDDTKCSAIPCSICGGSDSLDRKHVCVGHELKIAPEHTMAEHCELCAEVKRRGAEIDSLRAQVAEEQACCRREHVARVGAEEMVVSLRSQLDEAEKKLAEIDKRRAEDGQHAGCRINERQYRAELATQAVKLAEAREECERLRARVEQVERALNLATLRLVDYVRMFPDDKQSKALVADGAAILSGRAAGPGKDQK